MRSQSASLDDISALQNRANSQSTTQAWKNNNTVLLPAVVVVLFVIIDLPSL